MQNVEYTASSRQARSSFQQQVAWRLYIRPVACCLRTCCACRSVQEVEGAGGLQIVVAPSSGGDAQEAEAHLSSMHDFKLLMVQVRVHTTQVT